MLCTSAHLIQKFTEFTHVFRGNRVGEKQLEIYTFDTVRALIRQNKPSSERAGDEKALNSFIFAA